MIKKTGYTFAEILITLLIVGIVAGITMPSLITNINKKIKTHLNEVVTTRLINGLNLFNIQESGLAHTYENTYYFLKDLSKYYKMSKICDADHLKDCVPYTKLKFDDNGADNIDISLLKSKLKFPENFLEPAGFISAGGTPFILALSAYCGELDPDIADTDKRMSTKNGAISICLSGIYDLNGSRTPNKLNNDVVAFNGAKISKYVYNDGKIKLMSIYNSRAYSGLDARRGTALYQKYKLSGSGYINDGWVRAQELCAQDGGHLPSAKELADIASAVYVDNNGDAITIGEKENKTSIAFNDNSELASIIKQLKNTNGITYLWSSAIHETDPAAGAMLQSFSSNSTAWGGSRRNNTYEGIVCIAN